VCFGAWRSCWPIRPSIRPSPDRSPQDPQRRSQTRTVHPQAAVAPQKPDSQTARQPRRPEKARTRPQPTTTGSGTRLYHNPARWRWSRASTRSTLTTLLLFPFPLLSSNLFYLQRHPRPYLLSILSCFFRFLSILLPHGSSVHSFTATIPLIQLPSIQPDRSLPFTFA
jgi:hypothetical protein